MGRWTQYDEDDYRLPEGMKRVGYDADTQKYTFVDQDGNYWEGPEGQEYGELKRTGETRRPSRDLEASVSTRADGYQPLNVDNAKSIQERNRDAWRQILPFFLIIMVFLLLVFRLASPSILKPRPTSCPDHSRPYEIKAGDTCWAIAKDYGTSVDVIRGANPGLECSALSPGQSICVPVVD